MTARPTRFPELNDVLAELVASVRGVLDENVCGTYLQGSFAVGGADEHSDVDFVVVTHGELSAEQFAALDAMHGRLYALEVPWAQHLEGSYITADLLRRVDPSQSPLPYLDNGASRLVWDDHCNTAIVRWSLREHGVVLAGPDPHTLVEPVSAAQLRSEALAALPKYAAWAPEPTRAGPMSRWKQAYLVVTVCRLLQTLETGTVVSKHDAAEWAKGALDPRWAALIQRADDDRPDPWLRVYQPAAGEAIDRTLAFVEYGLDVSAAR
ncbi:MAG: DUF4111 domain-containing protein [Actinobacteria bacterium]|nr:DUF4111 domain-containing protein [Actinomycetota bacterium]